jgi:hypothetical protein
MESLLAIGDLELRKRDICARSGLVKHFMFVTCRLS